MERSFHTPLPLTLDVSIPVGDIDVETVDGEESTIVLDGDENLLEHVVVDHEGDRLPVEPDPPGGEHLHAGLERRHLDRLAGDVDPDRVVRHVLAEQHADHPGHGQRRAGVPAGHPGGRDR